MIQNQEEAKNEIEEENATNETESDSDMYETVSTTIKKMTIPEDFSFPVIDSAGNHIFSVTQREINENKELYVYLGE